MGNVCCCVQVEEHTVGLTKRFGKFDRTLQPGFHFIPWICGYQLAGNLSLQWQNLLVKCKTKTKDDDFVNVAAYVQYRVHQDKAYEAFYMHSNPRGQIQGYVLKVIGAMVAVRNMDEVSEQRAAISQAIIQEMQEPMLLYGYEILEVQICDVKLDEGLERAMIEAKNAKRKAEGEAEFKKHVTRQSQAIADATRDISGKIPGVTGKDYFDMALMSQYFESMSEIGRKSKSSVLFIPQGPGAMREVTAKVHDGLLEASTSNAK